MLWLTQVDLEKWMLKRRVRDVISSYVLTVGVWMRRYWMQLLCVQRRRFSAICAGAASALRPHH